MLATWPWAACRGAVRGPKMLPSTCIMQPHQCALLRSCRAGQAKRLWARRQHRTLRCHSVPARKPRNRLRDRSDLRSGATDEPVITDVWCSNACCLAVRVS